MRSTNETGEGRMGTIIGLLAMGAIGFSLWRVIPAYYANYSFQDKVIEVCRLPKYVANDEEIQKKLFAAARQYDIDPFFSAETCKVNTGEHRRRIACAYQRKVEVLPGFKHTFNFEAEADQPLI